MRWDTLGFVSKRSLWIKLGRARLQPSRRQARRRCVGRLAVTAHGFSRQSLMLVLLTISITSLALAGNHNQTRNIRTVCCPYCGEVCHPTVSMETETKRCWDVETKAICIPKIRFPWHQAANGKGKVKAGCLPTLWGKVKHVNLLVFHEYECSVCKTTWDPTSFKAKKD